MDNRAIGVFDSGLGGLTTVKKLLEFLPNDDIIYLGDTGRVPYGSRSRETIIKYAGQDAVFLAGFDIKAMVIACNTVCGVAFDTLNSAYDLPVFEVITAPVRAAISATRNGKIGVIGTAATIRSGAYESAIDLAMPDAAVFSEPCPLFVPLIENNRLSVNDPAAMTIAADYLSPLRSAGVDTLILGCTHYPLLRDVISEVMGPEVALIDSGAETAKHIAAYLRKSNMLPESDRQGTVKYFVTDSAEGFSRHASLFMEMEVEGMVEQVDLD